MIRRKIVRLLEEAVAEAQKQGSLPQVALPEVMLERPQSAGHGDYASNFPMKLARVAKANPMNLAEKIVPLIRPIPELEKVEVGESTSDSWQLEQRVKHAENQLAVSGRTTG